MNKRDRFGLEFYEGLVQRLIKNNSSQTLEFEGLPHSRIVMTNLLSVANEEVNLFWRTLNQPLWRDEGVYNAVIDAIERGVKFKVAIQQSEGRDSVTQEVLLDYKVPTIKLGTEEMADGNFVSCDGKAYAFWKNSVQKGVVCFNSPDLASRMKVVYGFKAAVI